MRKSSIPTLLGLFILTIVLVSIVFIIKAPQIFKSGASGSTIPRDIRITNITDTSITVSWFTDKPSIGFVKYTTGNQSTNTTVTNLSKTHLIIIQNLNPGTIYSINVNSDGEFFDAKQVQTLLSYTPGSTIISGQILDENHLPAHNVIVYIATEGIIKYSALTSVSGNWVAAMPQLSDSTILQILAVDGGIESSAFVDLKSAKSMPPMILGKNYDFRNNEVKQTNDIPTLDINL